MKGYFIGGCHVSAFPYPESSGFVHQVGQQQEMKTQIVHAHVGLSKLEQILPGITVQERQVFVFQLGNYEFGGSLTSVLKTVFNLKLQPRPTGMVTQSAAAHPAQPSSLRIDHHFARGKKVQALRNNKKPVKQWLLTSLYSSLYLAGFFVLNRHGAHFKLLSQFITQHPKACIVFLTPLPAVGFLDNQLRKLGGWIMKRKLRTHEHVQWINTHEVIPASEAYFVDDAHLNVRAHGMLAQAINQRITGWQGND
jgi:hypothetical protein